MKLSERSRGFSRSLTALLACLQVSTLSLLPAFAADNNVRVAGSTVFSIPGPADYASDRAEKIQRNVENSLVASGERGPSAVKVTYVKGLPVITIGGFYISTIDNATAKAAGTTPTLLADKWAAQLKKALQDRSSVDSYIAQLSGAATNVDYADSYDTSTSAPEAAPASAPVYTAASAPAAASSNTGWQSMPADYAASSAAPAYQSPQYAAAPQQASYSPVNYYQGRVVYIPAGMKIPVKLATALSSQVAKAGDLIVAKTTEPITLANGVIPADSVLTGQVTEASDGAWLGRSGRLGIKFNSLRTPGGVEVPISASISGSVGKYGDNDRDVFAGENTGSKVKKTLVATAVGAGGGSALGLAVGAIAGGGRGVGKGAWSGAAIGAGAGLVQGLLARKGAEVNLQQGAVFDLQLDAPVTVAMN